MKLASLESPGELGSWAFWKPRLARGLLIGALFVAAAQVFPTLPRDQEVRVQLSQGHLREVRVTYLQDSMSLAGATVRPGRGGTHASHTTSLKNGDYKISLDAIGEDVSGKSRTWQLTTTVRLAGKPVVIRLD